MIDPIHIGAYAGENGVSGLCFTPRMSPAHSPMKYKMPIFFTNKWTSTVSLAAADHISCCRISSAYHAVFIHWHNIFVGHCACLMLHYWHDSLLKDFCWFSTADDSPPTYKNVLSLVLKILVFVCHEFFVRHTK